MAYAADLDHQLAAEDRTKQRQYVLSGTRGRWRVLGLGVVLLSAIRLAGVVPVAWRSEEHTSELQSRLHLVCRLLLEKKKYGQVDLGDVVLYFLLGHSNTIIGYCNAHYFFIKGNRDLKIPQFSVVLSSRGQAFDHLHS